MFRCHLRGAEHRLVVYAPGRMASGSPQRQMDDCRRFDTLDSVEFTNSFGCNYLSVASLRIQVSALTGRQLLFC